MPIHALSSEDRRLRAEFESGELAPARFDHRTHLRLAYAYLAEHEIDAAHELVRSGLQRYLRHHGIDPAKYHETLTRAWLLAVRHFMASAPAARSAGEFLTENAVLLDSRILRTHYSAEVLDSADARRSFVEPDLDPIPRHAP